MRQPNTFRHLKNKTKAAATIFQRYICKLTINILFTKMFEIIVLFHDSSYWKLLK